MDLNFNKVTYDGDLADFEAERLREIISEFETAQESNVAEFEKAAEATDDIDESTIEDFEDAREGLIEDITEAEAFDEVPLTEDKLEEENFSDLQDWKAFVAETDTDESEGDEGGEGEGEGTFDDFGTKSPNGSDDDDEDFVEEQLGDMPGFTL